MPTQSLSAVMQLEEHIALLPGATDFSVMSLEDRLIQGFATSSVQADRDAAAINAMFRRSDITNPEVLAELQVRMAEYNIDVNMLNMLVRKAVGTVETLLRSS